MQVKGSKYTIFGTHEGWTDSVVLLLVERSCTIYGLREHSV
jgi:hypothetical protein